MILCLKMLVYATDIWMLCSNTWKMRILRLNFLHSKISSIRTITNFLWNLQLRKIAFYAIKNLLEKSVLDKPTILGKVCPAIIGLSNLPFKNHDVDYYTNAIEVSVWREILLSIRDHIEKTLIEQFLKYEEYVSPSGLVVLVHFKILSQPALMSNAYF